MVDVRSGKIYETIHKVDTLNKAIRLWSEYFPDDKPARTSAVVSYLGKNILMEIDAIAHA